LTWEFNHGNQDIMVDKQKFNRYFSVLLGRQWLYAPDASDEQIRKFFCEQKQVVVKTNRGEKGAGVYKLSYSDVTDIKAFCESAQKDCLMLEETVKQHPDLSSINPTSVNTLRINTVMDKAGVPHILSAALRMGVGQSITDNFSSGGVVAQIDLDSGILFTLAVGKDAQTYIKHPTSGVVLPGFQIPHWESVKGIVLSAAKMVPQTRWIGWDVAVTEQRPLLIEGNSDPGGNLMQLATQTGVYYTLRSYL
jgi:hypothetical protein